MNNNTKLVNALLKGENISEIFRAEVEKALYLAVEKIVKNVQEL